MQKNKTQNYKNHLQNFSITEISYTIILLLIQVSLNKFPDFFRMSTFIDSSHMKL